MKSFLESKAMAKALRQSLAARNMEISHSECLELVARQFGLADWNVLAAHIETAKAKLEPLRMPPGWFATGFTDIHRYRIGLDPSSPGCALIECTVGRETDLGNERFACMMQSIEADNYRGTTIRLTANIRAEAANVGTLWMRVDAPSQPSMRFDNMLQRETDGAIHGTSGWIQRSIVLDVPEESASIHYGFFLKGYGKMWARNFRLQAVTDGTAITHMRTNSQEPKVLPKLPANLDFMAPSM